MHQYSISQPTKYIQTHSVVKVVILIDNVNKLQGTAKKNFLTDHMIIMEKQNNSVVTCCLFEPTGVRIIIILKKVKSLAFLEGMLPH